MSCERFKKALHDYYVEDITPEETEVMFAHARSCPDCDAIMQAAAEISCREFIEFLNEYVDEELEPERRAVFDRHLAICPDCTAYLDSYRKTMSLSALAIRGAVEEPPTDLVLAILRARRA